MSEGVMRNNKILVLCLMFLVTGVAKSDGNEELMKILNKIKGIKEKSNYDSDYVSIIYYDDYRAVTKKLNDIMEDSSKYRNALILRVSMMAENSLQKSLNKNEVLKVPYMTEEELRIYKMDLFGTILSKIESDTKKRKTEITDNFYTILVSKSNFIANYSFGKDKYDKDIITYNYPKPIALKINVAKYKKDSKVIHWSECPFFIKCRLGDIKDGVIKSFKFNKGYNCVFENIILEDSDNFYVLTYCLEYGDGKVIIKK